MRVSVVMRELAGCEVLTLTARCPERVDLNWDAERGKPGRAFRFDVRVGHRLRGCQLHHATCWMFA